MMTKLLYSSSFDPGVNVNMRIINDAKILEKIASSSQFDYDSLKPDSNHTAIHLVALGDFEHYGFNRNYDGFPKEACEKYHHTFVDHGAVFRHHRNKDRENNLGLIKASNYNRDMARIELFIHANNDRAAPELTRLEKEGSVPYSMACFLAGTKIITETGVKNIEDIKSGDIVLTHTGAWHTVGNVMKREVDEHYAVTATSWGGTTCFTTGNHPFYAANFADVPRKLHSQSGEQPCKAFRRRNRGELHRHLKWVDAKDLSPHHYLAVPIDRRQDTEVDLLWARLLGYYIAEGSISQGTVNFSCHVNDDALDEVPHLARWTSTNVRPLRHTTQGVALDCFGTSIKQRIIAACGVTLVNKRIPAEIITANSEAKYNFIAAWFNGDGWQDSSGIHISTASQGLAIGLQRLLASLDIPTSCARINHPAGRGIAAPPGVEYVVNISNAYSGAFSDISKATDISIVGTTKMRTFISGDYLMVPVTSVDAVSEPATVYNFSVDNDESYTVLGLAVHNCRVPGDRCSICGTFRKNAMDNNMCDHIRNELGTMYDDGKTVGMLNDDPTFFDISFVGRPADRIAWDLKVASDEIIDSVKLAEYENIWVPDTIMLNNANAKSKANILDKIAEMQDKILGWYNNGILESDIYLNTVMKAASSLDDAYITSLRELDIDAALTKLAKSAIILNPEDYVKYALGCDHTSVKLASNKIKANIYSTIKLMSETKNRSAVCNETKYDVNLNTKIASSVLDSRILDNIAEGINFNIDTKLNLVFNRRQHEDELAKKYAAYQVAAINAILQHSDIDIDNLAVIAAFQNMQE